MIKFVIKRANLNDEVIDLKQTFTTKEQYLILITSNVNVKTKSIRIRAGTQRVYSVPSQTSLYSPSKIDILGSTNSNTLNGGYKIFNNSVSGSIIPPQEQ